MILESSKGILLKVKIVTKAAHNEIIGWEGDELKIRLNAIPEKGKANAELIQFLADFFSIGVSKIDLIHGLTSRHKILCISGITRTAMLEKLK